VPLRKESPEEVMSFRRPAWSIPLASQGVYYTNLPSYSKGCESGRHLWRYGSCGRGPDRDVAGWIDVARRAGIIDRVSNVRGLSADADRPREVTDRDGRAAAAARFLAGAGASAPPVTHAACARLRLTSLTMCYRICPHGSGCPPCRNGALTGNHRALVGGTARALSLNPRRGVSPAPASGGDSRIVAGAGTRVLAWK
jgi:hypothetical protein